MPKTEKKTEKKTKKKFQAEVTKILHLMVHSLYSKKEIFLRELVSNASDALDKFRFEAISNTKLSSKEELHIRLLPNKKERTLTIEDNGIGMDYQEVQDNIGTIAQSGTTQFLDKLQEAKDQPDLIGQFGVGFYSSFIVADKVSLHTQKAGEETGVVWESTGDGTYTLEKKAREKGHGTSVTLFLKEDLDQDFTEEWVLKMFVKKYSDFISFPIKMECVREKPIEKSTDKSADKSAEKSPEKYMEDEVLNSRTAVWLQSAKDLSKDEYKEFYKHISHDWNDPHKHIHFKAEGTSEFSALVYVPSQAPRDFYLQDGKWGLQLYTKRVFITANCEGLIPSYLRFLKGVVDSSDLSLNVSREMLQQDHQVQQIKKALTSKVLSCFKDWIKKDRSEYEKLWATFGAVFKEGVHSDYGNKEKLLDLLLFTSTEEENKYTTLSEYVERKKEDQKSIFYLTGDKIDEIRKSPILERFRSKGYEVLLLTDPIDEWVTNAIDNYKDMEFLSVLDEKLDIDSETEKKDREKKAKQTEKMLNPVVMVFKNTLNEKLQDVRLSRRLVSSPVCLVSSGSSARMERIIANATGEKMSASKRILEINPDHKVIQKMSSLDDTAKANWAKILYSQALLQEGSPVENPVGLSQEIVELMGSI